MGELLRRGFDVYMTLVDDQQIDCVVRQERDGKPHYIDIQIKARSKDCQPKNAGRFAAMEIRKPRENFFFIFFSERAGKYWVMSSLDVIREANRNKTGKNSGKYSLNLCNPTGPEGAKPLPRFQKYEDAFDLLKKELRTSSSAVSARPTRV